jgi:ABC-type transporter Mla maintaining outer membrane lipid asymmetry ATPase subunit MlaF
VLVEQSVNVALAVADRAVFLEKGRVRFSGPAADLLDRTDLVRAVFLGAYRDAAHDVLPAAPSGGGAGTGGQGES